MKTWEKLAWGCGVVLGLLAVYGIRSSVNYDRRRTAACNAQGGVFVKVGTEGYVCAKVEQIPMPLVTP